MTREQVNAIWRFRDAIAYARRSGMALFVAHGALYLVPQEFRAGIEKGQLSQGELANYRVGEPH